MGKALENLAKTLKIYGIPCEIEMGAKDYLLFIPNVKDWVWFVNEQGDKFELSCKKARSLSVYTVTMTESEIVERLCPNKPAEREKYDLRRLTAVLQTLCHEGLSDSQVAVNCGGRKEIKEIRHLKDGTIEIVAEGA